MDIPHENNIKLETLLTIDRISQCLILITLPFLSQNSQAHRNKAGKIVKHKS